MLKRRQVAETGEAEMMGRGVTKVQREREVHPRGLRISPRESGSTLTSMVKGGPPSRGRGAGLGGAGQPCSRLSDISGLVLSREAEAAASWE